MAEGLPVAAFGVKSTEFGVVGKTPGGTGCIHALAVVAAIHCGASTRGVNCLHAEFAAANPLN